MEEQYSYGNQKWYLKAMAELCLWVVIMYLAYVFISILLKQSWSADFEKTLFWIQALKIIDETFGILFPIFPALIVIGIFLGMFFSVSTRNIFKKYPPHSLDIYILTLPYYQNIVYFLSNHQNEKIMNFVFERFGVLFCICR